MTEGEFQGQVIHLAMLLGWQVNHQRPAQVGGRWLTATQGHTGFPDLVLAHPTRGVIFAELKTQRGRLSPHQQAWQHALIAGGAECYVWRPDQLDTITARLRAAL